ncbi:hypothetical protein LTR53_018148, partial [Teratosphaeriaceae sp. CCFEE 6253]
MERLEPTPWLRFTAWHQYLGGFDRGQLLSSIWPTDDEGEEDGVASLLIEDDDEAAGLGRACRATRQLIRQVMTTARVHIVSRAALEAVHRRECGVASNERLFYAEQKVQRI